MTYDPAFMNTANCRSAITYIDGDKGILLYRGYPIEQLAEESDFLETAYLVLFGELPTAVQMQQWTREITHHTMLHENIKKLMEGFQYDAHPMAIFLSIVGAMSGFYPDAKHIFDKEARLRQTYRAIAKVPSIAAWAYRHSIGRPYVYPDNDLSFTGNFLNMLFKMTELKYQPNPVLARALDVLFILHADHEQNCSTTTMRTIGSSHADPYSSLAGAAGALYGPLHGGANEAVLRMLHEIGSVGKVPDFIKKVKSGDGATRLMGFGHRVYKSYDPRAKVIKKIADLVFAVTGKNPLLEIALELERIALQDDYFVTPQAVSERRLLLGAHLPGDGVPGRDVPGPLRDSAHRRLDRAVGGDAARSRAEDRAAAADLHRPAQRTTSRGRNAHDYAPAPALVAALAAAGRTAAPREVRLRPRVGASAAARRHRSAAGADRRRSSRRGSTSRSSSRPAGLTAIEQAWDDQTPIDKVKMVNLVATIPGARKERIVIAGHYDTKLYREFRFVGASDGGSSAAFLLEIARVLQVAQEPDDDRAPVPRRRGGAAARLERHRQHLRQPPLRRGGAARRIARDAEGDDPRRHDRRPRSRHPPRHQLDAVADQHHLGRGEAAEARRLLPRRLDADRGRSPAVPRGRRAVGRHHRSRLRAVAHGEGHARRVSARSLQVVGDVVLAALPQIEPHLTKGLVLTGRRVHSPKRFVTLNAKRKLRPRDRLKERRRSSLDLAAAH